MSQKVSGLGKSASSLRFTGLHRHSQPPAQPISVASPRGTPHVTWFSENYHCHHRHRHQNTSLLPQGRVREPRFTAQVR